MDQHATTAQALFLYKGRVFSRDNVNQEGFPLDPQPFLVRACYVASEEQLQQSWPSILTTIKEPKPQQMLQLLPSPDGPPYRAARLFYLGGQDTLYANKGRSTLSVDVLYPIGDSGQPWDSDVRRLKPGLFITGEGGPTNLWRIHRIERDAWRGPLFTLAPLLLASGFPILDLSGVRDADRRKEIASHYDELGWKNRGQVLQSNIKRFLGAGLGSSAYVAGGAGPRRGIASAHPPTHPMRMVGVFATCMEESGSGLAIQHQEVSWRGAG